ncbi:hypothetical protein JQC92_21960 [Shewanella sp. 202IG2-18]|uniref:hypothetical protein n=1 Tax=Parashewanella hymeniacidonis TaxID=2807618 RepID=UPI0019617EA1|nr:hypothetical protein [Parashewanella hymeniacidonis]MBM7074642.1 hypothetical protein [Parashewanella hymeniacidonis]
MATALTRSEGSPVPTPNQISSSNSSSLNKVKFEEIECTFYNQKELIYPCPICFENPAIKNFCGENKEGHNLCEPCFKLYQKEYEKKDCPSCRKGIASSTIRAKIDKKLEKAFRDLVVECSC